MQINESVLDVLSNAVVNGNSLKLVQQLDRQLYVATVDFVDSLSKNGELAEGLAERVTL